MSASIDEVNQNLLIELLDKEQWSEAIQLLNKKSDGQKFSKKFFYTSVLPNIEKFKLDVILTIIAHCHLFDATVTLFHAVKDKAHQLEDITLTEQHSLRIIKAILMLLRYQKSKNLSINKTLKNNIWGFLACLAEKEGYITKNCESILKLAIEHHEELSPLSKLLPHIQDRVTIRNAFHFALDQKDAVLVKQILLLKKIESKDTHVALIRALREGDFENFEAYMECGNIVPSSSTVAELIHAIDKKKSDPNFNHTEACALLDRTSAKTTDGLLEKYVSEKSWHKILELISRNRDELPSQECIDMLLKNNLHDLRIDVILSVLSKYSSVEPIEFKNQLFCEIDQQAEEIINSEFNSQDANTFLLVIAQRMSVGYTNYNLKRVQDAIARLVTYATEIEVLNFLFSRAVHSLYYDTATQLFHRVDKATREVALRMMFSCNWQDERQIQKIIDLKPSQDDVDILLLSTVFDPDFLKSHEILLKCIAEGGPSQKALKKTIDLKIQHKRWDIVTHLLEKLNDSSYNEFKKDLIINTDEECNIENFKKMLLNIENSLEANDFNTILANALSGGRWDIIEHLCVDRTPGNTGPGAEMVNTCMTQVKNTEFKPRLWISIDVEISQSLQRLKKVPLDIKKQVKSSSSAHSSDLGSKTQSDTSKQGSPPPTITATGDARPPAEPHVLNTPSITAAKQPLKVEDPTHSLPDKNIRTGKNLDNTTPKKQELEAEDRAKIEHAKKAYDIHLKSFEKIINILKEKVVKNHEKYNAVLEKAIESYRILNATSKTFFENSSPDSVTFTLFKESCETTINDAANVFKNHRGFWYSMNPIFRGILGVLAALTVIPALVIEITSKATGSTHNYSAIFFSSPKTKTLEQLESFDETKNSVLEDIESKLKLK